MKTPQAGGGKIGIILLLALLLLICRSGQAQGDFQNLDFESANITVVPLGNGPSTATVQGWTAYVSPSINNPTYDTYTIYYDTFALDLGGIFLEDANFPYAEGPGGYSLLPIEGNYSIFLQGADLAQAETVASIGQTGTIPSDAQSLTFWSRQTGGLQVSFNGQPIDYLVTGSTANYTIYSADISAYAGETGQLLFTAPLFYTALIDNIQFSSTPVPEPGTFALTALGTVLLGCRRWKRL